MYRYFKIFGAKSEYFLHYKKYLFAFFNSMKRIEIGKENQNIP